MPTSVPPSARSTSRRTESENTFCGRSTNASHADRELDLFLGLFAIPTDAATLMLPDETEDDRDENRRTGEGDQ